MILAFTIATLSLLLMVNQFVASEHGIKLMRGDTHVVLPIAVCSSISMLGSLWMRTASLMPYFCRPFL